MSRILGRIRSAIKMKGNSRSCSGTAYVSNVKAFNMNDLPVPSGSWQAANAARQRRNNLILATGIVWLLFSIGLARSSGLLWFGWGPPMKNPVKCPKEEMKGKAAAEAK